MTEAARFGPSVGIALDARGLRLLLAHGLMSFLLCREVGSVDRSLEPNYFVAEVAPEGVVVVPFVSMTPGLSGTLEFINRFFATHYHFLSHFHTPLDAIVVGLHTFVDMKHRSSYLFSFLFVVLRSSSSSCRTFRT